MKRLIFRVFFILCSDRFRFHSKYLEQKSRISNTFAHIPQNKSKPKTILTCIRQQSSIFLFQNSSAAP